jgi:hypothetical protein
MKLRFKNQVKKRSGFLPVATSTNIWSNSMNRPAAKFYGDYDKDGIMNGFDCSPHNARLQGPQHKLTQEQINYNKGLEEEMKKKSEAEDQLGWKDGKGSEKASTNITKITKQWKHGWVPHQDND